MPRTVQVLLLGFGILLLLALFGRIIGGQNGMLKAMGWFIPAWFILSGFNMLEGVRAGHGFFEEIPYLLINFGIPAVAAFFALKKLA